MMECHNANTKIVYIISEWQLIGFSRENVLEQCTGKHTIVFSGILIIFFSDYLLVYTELCISELQSQVVRVFKAGW